MLKGKKAVVEYFKFKENGVEIVLDFILPPHRTCTQGIITFLLTDGSFCKQVRKLINDYTKVELIADEEQFKKECKGIVVYLAKGLVNTYKTLQEVRDKVDSMNYVN